MEECAMRDNMPYVRFRALEMEDLEELYEIENDESLWEVGNTNVPYSRSLLTDYIASAKCDIYADRQVRMMVENKEGDVIGIVDLINFEPQHLRAELGIVIKKAYRHQHYATAALLKIVEYGKNVIHLHQIYAIVAVDNVCCMSLLKNTGFQSDIKLKDWLQKGEKYIDAYMMQKIL